MIQRSFKFTNSFWSILSILRFCLAIIVIASHIHLFASVPSLLVKIEMLGGKAAVLSFLLISGISIGHSYLRSKNGYLKRRFLRIYPLYFFAVLFTVFLQYFLGSPFHLPGQTMAVAGLSTSIANLLLLQGFISIPVTYNQPLWSISVEVFFYLLVPFLVKLPSKILYGVIFISMFFYSLTYFYFRFTIWGYVALIYAWPWITGFLMAKGNKIYISISLFILGAAVIFSNRIIAIEALGCLTYLFVGIIILIFGFISIRLHEEINVLFNFLGEISYPLYLFHIPLWLLFYYFGLRNTWCFMVLAIVAVIPINYLLDHWLKRVFWKPMLTFLNSYFTTYRSDLNKKPAILSQTKNNK